MQQVSGGEIGKKQMCDQKTDVWLCQVWRALQPLSGQRDKGTVLFDAGYRVSLFFTFVFTSSGSEWTPCDFALPPGQAACLPKTLTYSCCLLSRLSKASPSSGHFRTSESMVLT
jgi:hypothetical protein